jgi:hypothetical protein
LPPGTVWALAFAALMIMGCHAALRDNPGAAAQKPPSDPMHQKGDARMEFKTRTLLTRYGPPPSGQPEPTLTIFHNKAAWDGFAKSHNGAQESLVRLAIDWPASVVLLVQTGTEGGMDLFPSIAAFSRERDVVDIRIEMVPNPDAQMADVVVQPWLIAEAPKGAFAGTPEIRFAVKGQSGGKVVHQR